MNAGEFLGSAGEQMARQVMLRREGAIKNTIHSAVGAEWFNLGAAAPHREDVDAIAAITNAVVRNLAAVSHAIAEADRTPPVVEVIEGEGHHVRIRTVVPEWSPITPDHWLNEPGPGVRP